MDDKDLLLLGAKTRIAALEEAFSDATVRLDAAMNIIALAHFGTRPIHGVVRGPLSEITGHAIVCCEHIGHAEMHAVNLISAEAEKIRKEREL